MAYLNTNTHSGANFEVFALASMAAVEDLGRYDRLPRYIIVGTGGDLVLTNSLGVAVTVVLTAGFVYPIAAASITLSGSTADDITVIW